MNRLNKVTLAVSTMALSLALTAPAGAGTPLGMDLTGTWIGTATCKGIDSTGAPIKQTMPLAAGIVSYDASFAVEFAVTGPDVMGAGIPRGVAPDSGMCGVAFQRAGKPGKGMATMSSFSPIGVPVYSGDFPLDSALIKSVKTYPVDSKGNSGIMSGSGAFIPYAGGYVVGCTFKFTRVDVSAPTIDPDLVDLCAGI